MDKDKDIRWKQRLTNYKRALKQLNSAVDLAQQRELSTLEEQGLIQSFEFTHELAWKVMKDFFHYQGNTDLYGSRDATREAFANDLITDGDGWMEMLKSRNLSSHTYNEETAEEITKKIIEHYRELFQQFLIKMEALEAGQ